MRSILYSLALFLVLPAVAFAQPTALTNVTVVNPPDAPTVEGATVLIEEDRIADVGPAEAIDLPEDAEAIDASGQYVMPGLVDGHIHFFQSGGLYTRPDVIDLRDVRPYEEELALIRDRIDDTFARYLRSGVTGVVDVGGPNWNLDVRDRAANIAQAPDVVVAGPLISPVQPDPLATDDPPILSINDPEEARAEVRRQVEAGFDLIKIWYIVRAGETPADYRPVAEAVVDEAHEAGVRVAVHATELETARTSVEIGADILVHSVSDQPVDDDFVEQVVENEVIYTPTLIVSERYQRVFAQQLDLLPAEEEWAHPEVMESLTDLRRLGDEHVPAQIQARIERDDPVPSDTTAMENLRQLYEAGATVAAGTDAGNIGTLHGPSIFREIELMSESGLSPMEILETATINGAQLMGTPDRRGTVEAGQVADLVILDDDPREGVDAWSSIDRVVRAGQLFDAGELVE